MSALLLGVVAGLRTFTAPAILRLLRSGGAPAYALAALALLEYGGDLHPKAPARTSSAPLIARLLSAAWCGWTVAGADVAARRRSAMLGACGAAIGAYVGLAARTRAISCIGAVPAALIEDGVAIAVASVVVVNA